MVTIYAAKWTTDITPFLHYLPADVRTRASKFLHLKDAKFSLLGRLLLLIALKKHGFIELTLPDIRYNTANRPHFTEGPDFNITHSGDYVLCGLTTTGRLGIDLESTRPIDLQDFIDIGSAREVVQIKSSDHPVESFYNLWTRKEAIIKADGDGLQIPLNSFEVIDDRIRIREKTWYLKRVRFLQGYILHIATDMHLDDGIQVEYPPLSNLYCP